MQVTSVADHVSHAVINAGETMEFSVSDDPMFFQMLSSTLYTRQTEAMVRETLCNAWDAHIDAGIADTPIEVTLDGDYLTIRDYGKGIPHDMIRPIYLIYGKSTKANSSNQTGGFGLGCKAPFAYSDHFEVRSYHNGKCTIYNMSKASLEHEGRPAASVVASIPTQETGLQVRVPLVRDSNSYLEIRNLVQHLVTLGGINAILRTKGNEATAIPTINLGTQPGSFLMAQKIFNMSKTSHKIYVRYGSVVYPVEESTGYAEEYRELLRNLQIVSGMDYMGIVFQAGPDTICIPPSRESLSITPLTEATIKQLISGYLKDFDKAYYERSRKMVLERFAEIIADPAEKGYALLKQDVFGYLGLKYRGSRNNHQLSPMNAATEITTQQQALDQAVRAGLPSVKAFVNLVEKERFDAISAKKLIPDHWLKSIRKLSESNLHSNSAIGYSDFLMREVFAPLLAKIDNHPDLDKKQFGVLAVGQYSYNNSLSVLPLDKLGNSNQERTLMLCRGNIVLSYTKKAVIEQDYCHPAVDGITGAKNHLMVYTVPRTKGTVGKVRQAFANMRGYTIIDLTIEQDSEKAERDKAIRSQNGGRSPRAKKEGFQAASGAFRLDGNKPNYDQYWADFSNLRDVRILNPKWAEPRPTKGRGNSNSCLVPGLTPSETRTLMSHIGDVGALAVSDVQYKKLSEDMKLPRAMDYALQVYDNWQQLNRDRLIAIDSLQWSTVMASSECQKLIKESKQDPQRIRQMFYLLRDHAETAEYFGLTQKDRSKPSDDGMIQLFSVLSSNINLIKDQKEWIRVLKEREAIKQSRTHHNARKVIEVIARSSAMHFLNTDRLSDSLESKNKEVRKAAAAFLIKTLNIYRG